MELKGPGELMPNLYNMSIRRVLRRMRGYSVRLIGSGIAVYQSQRPYTPMDKDRKYTIIFKPPIEYEVIRAYKNSG